MRRRGSATAEVSLQILDARHYRGYRRPHHRVGQPRLCILHLRIGARRRGLDLELHLAEFLAPTDDPGYRDRASSLTRHPPHHHALLEKIARYIFHHLNPDCKRP